jgi:hypothetical protein
MISEIMASIGILFGIYLLIVGIFIMWNREK